MNKMEQPKNENVVIANKKKSKENPSQQQQNHVVQINKEMKVYKSN